ncbi:polyketide synthase [Xylariaceae sp. FL0804]|nr:polyketide synthase [Xylariaceae sp. FL0804]
MEPIAIMGFSFKLPGEIKDELSLWEVLEQRNNLMTGWPPERLAIDALHAGGTTLQNKLPGRGAHFVSENPAVFDAPFFSITPAEAAAMDPQPRWALETAYHALETGIPIEKLRGSRTSVFAASSSDEPLTISPKDNLTISRTSGTGNSRAILANRISWYFDLVGPSVFIDTACSASLVALDLACQSLRAGESTAALVLGSSILLTPESTISLANMGFLSPDSLCYSFDHRANGFARGEGIVVLVIKLVSVAIQDGDMIRALVRSSGSNQDGHTPTLNQPNPASQEDLIRDVYRKAGLDPSRTRYVETHEEPLYVYVTTGCGHEQRLKSRCP